MTKRDLSRFIDRSTDIQPDLTVIRKYDPDELRDAAGRWTETGAGDDPSGALEMDRAIREDTAYDEAYSPWDEDRPPETERGDLTGMQFSSSSLHEKEFAQAKEALTGERQLAFDKASEEIDKRLGMAGVEHQDVIGAWADGAENSNMAEIRAPGSLEQLRLSAAMKGSLGNQKAVLIFQTDQHGHDTLYTMAAPGTPESMHADLLKAGIPYQTLATYPAGRDQNLTRVLVVDTDNSLHDKVEKFADAHGTAAMGYKGHAEFLGDTQGTGSDAEQRQRAQDAYAKVIAQATGRYQDGNAGAVWAGIRNRWADRLQALKRAFASFLDRHLGKYSPDQPRDDQGRWTSGGGGAAAPAAKPKRRTRVQRDIDEGAADIQAHETIIHGYHPPGTDIKPTGPLPPVFYHGTSEAAVQDVMKQGLVPSFGHGADDWGVEHEGFHMQNMKMGDRAQSVYVTGDPEVAGYFANLAATQNHSTPAMFKVTIPKDEEDARLLVDERSEPRMQNYRFIGTIPPKWITPVKVEDLPKGAQFFMTHGPGGVTFGKADGVVVVFVVMPTIGGTHKPVTAE